MHCFTDACIYYGVSAGAYVIDDDAPVSFLLPYRTSTDAELATMLMCLESIAVGPITMHIDLVHIEAILSRSAHCDLRRALRDRIQELKAVVLTDGRKHERYRRCHRAAGIMAGKHGTNHPRRPLPDNNDQMMLERIAQLKLKNVNKLRGGLH